MGRHSETEEHGKMTEGTRSSGTFERRADGTLRIDTPMKILRALMMMTMMIVVLTKR